MSVKLHKVTLFVVDTGDGDEQALDKLHGDCCHNCGAFIVETQTAEFDREWSDDDPLNKVDNMNNREFLEKLIRENA